MELLAQSRYSVTNTNCSCCNRSRETGKDCGWRRCLTPHVHFRSRVVCFLRPGNRQSSCWYHSRQTFKFIHDELGLFGPSVCSEQKTNTRSCRPLWVLKAGATTGWSTGFVMWLLYCRSRWGFLQAQFNWREGMFRSLTYSCVTLLVSGSHCLLIMNNMKMKNKFCKPSSLDWYLSVTS